MPPIICIAGKSKVGKTTLVEKLIAELKRRGYRVATIKRLFYDFDLDLPGKDSWRHAQAGSDAVVISSPQKLALIKKVDHEPTFAELAQLIGQDLDIILAEGFRHSKWPKIGVHRKEIGEGLMCTIEGLTAIATDEHLDINIPQYRLDDTEGLVDLIERKFLARRHKHAAR